MDDNKGSEEKQAQTPNAYAEEILARVQTLKATARLVSGLGIPVLTNYESLGHPGRAGSSRAGLTPEEISTQIGPASMLFVRGGGGFFTIDLDLPPHRCAYADRLLGWTTTADGRPHKLVSHIWVRSANAPDSFTVRKEGGIEIRGAKHTTKCAPSRYTKNGYDEYLAFLPGRGPDALISVDWDDLIERTNYVKAVNAVCDMWGAPGAEERVLPRHDLVLYLAGWLAKAGLDETAITDFIGHVIGMERDPDGMRDDYLQSIQSAVTRVEAGEQVAGYSVLVDSYPEERLKWLMGWLALPDHSTRVQTYNRDDFDSLGTVSGYIYHGTGDIFGGRKVDHFVGPVRSGRGRNGRASFMPASKWLDENRAVSQMIWAPGETEIIEGKYLRDGGWVDAPNKRSYNRYVPPPDFDGDPEKAERFLTLVQTIYPEEADEILDWLAHKVQFPAVKINHAIVFGGEQGIGKDTILTSCTTAFGQWNIAAVSPQRVMGRFNDYVRSLLIIISEAHDLGDISRYAFADAVKTLIATPPETILCEVKHVPTFPVLNMSSVCYTSNHRTLGIALPADDRRHFVCWSPVTRGQFLLNYWTDYYRWLYQGGGMGHVAAYLHMRDVSAFDPKAPPRLTDAWRDIVAAEVPPEELELISVVEPWLGDGTAFTQGMMVARAADVTPAFHEDGTAQVGLMDKEGLAMWLKTRKNRRLILDRLHKVGCCRVDNPDSAQGLWQIQGQRQTVYAPCRLSKSERIDAARRLL